MIGPPQDVLQRTTSKARSKSGSSRRRGRLALALPLKPEFETFVQDSKTLSLWLFRLADCLFSIAHCGLRAKRKWWGRRRVAATPRTLAQNASTSSLSFNVQQWQVFMRADPQSQMHWDSDVKLISLTLSSSPWSAHAVDRRSKPDKSFFHSKDPYADHSLSFVKPCRVRIGGRAVKIFAGPRIQARTQAAEDRWSRTFLSELARSHT